MKKNYQEIKRLEWLKKLGKITPKNKAENERLEKAFYYLENINDSTFGRLEELFSCTTHSRKNAVALQNAPDTFIKWKNENGKTVNRPAEVKTNGGRIGKMIERLQNGKDTLFIYSLDICNSGTGQQVRKIEPILCYFSQFYEMLLETNAIKETNGKNNELAIQPTSKKMFDRLQDWFIPYEPNTIYSEDDLDGLTF